MRDTLTILMAMVRALLAEGFTEVQAVSDVWLTLMSQDVRAAAMLGATAIVQLAEVEQPGAQMTMAPEPGS